MGCCGLGWVLLICLFPTFCVGVGIIYCLYWCGGGFRVWFWCFGIWCLGWFRRLDQVWEWFWFVCLVLSFFVGLRNGACGGWDFAVLVDWCFGWV